MMIASNPVDDRETYTSIPTYKLLLWLAMVSMVMMFAGLTSGYIVRQAEANWFVFELPKAFYISTILILLSSISVQWALYSVKHNKIAQLRIGLFITLGLGLAFTYSQFAGWSMLVQERIFFTGNPSGSFLYVLTGLHLAHLFGGIIYLMVVSTRSIQGRYHAQNYLSVSLCATFWHFLDGLWIYLFMFLMLVR